MVFRPSAPPRSGRTAAPQGRRQRPRARARAYRPDAVLAGQPGADRVRRPHAARPVHRARDRGAERDPLARQGPRRCCRAASRPTSSRRRRRRCSTPRRPSASSPARSVVIPLEGLDAEERERYVRLAHAHRRARHLVLVEAGKDSVAEEDRAALDRAAERARRGRARPRGLHDLAARRRADGGRAQAHRLRAASRGRLGAV